MDLVLIEGIVEIAAEPLGGDLHRVRVRIENLTPWHDEMGSEAARLGSLASAQVLLASSGGSFVSPTEPPEALREAAAACRSEGAWPTLAGPPGARDLVLCAPIILPDHATVAPESPGDLFDGTEIDELLTLRILTLTEAERIEAAAADPRVRALLERTAALGPEAIERLHGAIRQRTVRVAGVEIGPGARVRLRPGRQPRRSRGGKRRRADALDIVLSGMQATVVSIEQDYEDRAQIAVTIDADPGRDLGERGMPGHRFFFHPDEIEPLAPATRVLVAGIGNLFLGDDAFGLEVISRLRARPQPDGVRVIDFGVRCLDLAFALETCEAAIVVDATARGGRPGTLYVIEPDPGAPGAEGGALLGHGMTVDRVLGALQPGAGPRAVRVVGCEPAAFDGGEDGPAGLSAPVAAAVEPAVEMVETLAASFLREGRFHA